jgi:Na+-transporting NADH:ubiquinone oxidoreductase subunit A
MGIHTIRKGLDLPITGAPKQEVHDGPSVGRVALMAADYPYMKPKMLVQEGDQVKIG